MQYLLVKFYTLPFSLASFSQKMKWRNIKKDIDYGIQCVTLFLVLFFIVYVIFKAREDAPFMKRKDPACTSTWLVVLYSSFWAMLFHRPAHFLQTHKFYFLARVISQFSRLITGIEIHPGAKIGKEVFIDHGMGVVIGETAEIGNNVTIYQCVTLGGTGKDTGKRHPTVGSNVLIGTGAKVLGPIRIGNNSKIGAGSVVLEDVPSYSTVVGVPAKVIKREGHESVPADNLDQIHLTDPVFEEICSLKEKIAFLSEELEKVEGKSIKLRRKVKKAENNKTETKKEENKEQGAEKSQNSPSPETAEEIREKIKKAMVPIEEEN